MRIKLTLPTTEVGGFSGYALRNRIRLLLKGLPVPICGLDFTRKPNFCNHQSKLLKGFGRQTLSLFRFLHLSPTNIVKSVTQFKEGVKPDSSPVLKYGVFSGSSIKMTKRLMVAICIIVAALSFMGGMIYKYEDFIPAVTVDLAQAKYVMKYRMPLDKETAIYWFDWALSYHELCIEEQIVVDSRPAEYHQACVDMYTKMKGIYLEFDEEWGYGW